MAGDVKFIRVNGRVVPIKGKGPAKKKDESKSAEKTKKNASAYRSAVSKYKSDKDKGVAGKLFVAGAGLALGSMFVGNKTAKLNIALAGLASTSLGLIKGVKEEKNNRKNLSKIYSAEKKLKKYKTGV